MSVDNDPEMAALAEEILADRRILTKQRAYDLGLLFALSAQRGEAPCYSDDGFDVLARCSCCGKHEPVHLTPGLSRWLRKNSAGLVS